MEYKIIKVYGCPETDNLDMKLEDEVNVYINNGWRPFGSICIINVGTPEGYKNNFIEVWQPMIKNRYNSLLYDVNFKLNKKEN